MTLPNPMYIETKFRTLQGDQCSFSIDDEIGRGKYGIVFKGLIGEDNVAVKVTTNREQKDRIPQSITFRYIRLIGRYDCQNYSYLVFPLYDMDFDDFQASQDFKNKLPTQRAIIMTLILGLKALHKNRKVHFDVRFPNILLRRRQTFQCVLSDFGLSHEPSNETWMRALIKDYIGLFRVICRSYDYDWHQTKSQEFSAISTSIKLMAFKMKFIPIHYKIFIQSTQFDVQQFCKIFRESKKQAVDMFIRETYPYVLWTSNSVFSIQQSTENEKIVGIDKAKAIEKARKKRNLTMKLKQKCDKCGLNYQKKRKDRHLKKCLPL